MPNCDFNPTKLWKFKKRENNPFTKSLRKKSPQRHTGWEPQSPAWRFCFIHSDSTTYGLTWTHYTLSSSVLQGRQTITVHLHSCETKYTNNIKKHCTLRARLTHIVFNSLVQQFRISECPEFLYLKVISDQLPQLKTCCEHVDATVLLLAVQDVCTVSVQESETAGRAVWMCGSNEVLSASLSSGLSYVEERTCCRILPFRTLIPITDNNLLLHGRYRFHIFLF